MRKIEDVGIPVDGTVCSSCPAYGRWGDGAKECTSDNSLFSKLGWHTAVLRRHKKMNRGGVGRRCNITDDDIAIKGLNLIYKIAYILEE
jgi:hypothetical protein